MFLTKRWVDIDTVVVQVVVDKTLVILTQRKSDCGVYVLYKKTKPATGCQKRRTRKYNNPSNLLNIYSDYKRQCS